MILYEGRYRREGEKKWHPLKKVKGDHIYSAWLDKAKTHQQLTTQIQITFEDESVLFLPMTCEIEWTPSRFMSIHERMNQEAGQNINLNKR